MHWILFIFHSAFTFFSFGAHRILISSSSGMFSMPSSEVSPAISNSRYRNPVSFDRPVRSVILLYFRSVLSPVSLSTRICRASSLSQFHSVRYRFGSISRSPASRTSVTIARTFSGSVSSSSILISLNWSLLTPQPSPSAISLALKLLLFTMLRACRSSSSLTASRFPLIFRRALRSVRFCRFTSSRLISRSCPAVASIFRSFSQFISSSRRVPSFILVRSGME